MAKAVSVREAGPRARVRTAGVPWPLVRLLSARQARRSRALTAMVTIAVAFTVASSFAVTATTGASVRGVVGRVGATGLPFDAVALFAPGDDARVFRSKVSGWEGRARVEMFLWAREDTPEGSLTVLGTGGGLREGLFEAVAPSLGGWRTASPDTVRGMAGAQEGALFSFAGSANGDKVAREVEKLAATYPGTIVVTSRSGASLAESTSKRVSMPWQAISAGTLLISVAAISCVLAVAFLGRKRSLGILRVLGGTTPDLRRLFLVETAYLGGAGIPLGLLLGFGLTAATYGPGAATASCFLIATACGGAALAFGAYLPVRLIRNGTCDQLLNNRPVYVESNPSCAKCGLCGGF